MRKWPRELFTDHPKYIPNQNVTLRPPEVWANDAKDKVRVIYTLCLTDRVGAIASTKEEERAHNGEQIIPRSLEDIKLDLCCIIPFMLMFREAYLLVFVKTPR
ncbi:hypothetical protein BJ165DRAFT_1403602 [Panaeolus papilionaceus]|nr:hypothetical protein BJ165DRAFT_1403602 [Panaeolus papilionaceus]